MVIWTLLVYLVPTEARRSHVSSKNGVLGSYEPSMWVLGNLKLESSRTANACNHSAISLAPFIFETLPS